LRRSQKDNGIVWHTNIYYNVIVKSRAVTWLFFDGEMMMTRRGFYKTQAWRRARQCYIEYRHSVDGGMCEVCQAQPGRIVHHVIWLDDNNYNDPEVSLSPKNFRLECQACHNREIDPANIPGRCKYGVNGEIVRNTDY